MNKDYERGYVSGQAAIKNSELTLESIEAACEHSIEHMPEGNEHFDPNAQELFLRGRVAGAFGSLPAKEEEELK